jgi:hypothetical protein
MGCIPIAAAHSTSHLDHEASVYIVGLSAAWTGEARAAEDSEPFGVNIPVKTAHLTMYFSRRIQIAFVDFGS